MFFCSYRNRDKSCRVFVPVRDIIPCFMLPAIKDFSSLVLSRIFLPIAAKEFSSFLLQGVFLSFALNDFIFSFAVEDFSSFLLSRIFFSFTTEDFFLFLNHFVHLDLKLQPINSPFLIDFQSLESVKVELDKTLKEVTILRKQSGAGEEKVRNIYHEQTL